jgi:2-oxo-3-hexenedioate decarboxylase/2-keto-4-pentenoate hydratase
LNAQEISVLADRIAAFRRARTTMDFLAGATAGLSEEEAYQVQFAVHDRLTGTGGNRLAGWKVAFAVPAQYEPLKLSGPAFAGIYQDGVRQSGEVFTEGWPLKAGIECEMVARMAKDATAGNEPYTAESIQGYVSKLYCGMEVVENRYGDVSKVGGPGRIADDVLQAACIIGTEIKDWQKLDFATVQGRAEFEGKEIAAGPGANVMGGAMIALAWLANKLIGHGKSLKAGDVVLTGSVHPPQFLPGPGKARTEYAGLGSAEIIVK